MADCLDGYCRHAGLARQKFMKGQVAQSVEQRIENPCVGGSIPPLATNSFNDLHLKHLGIAKVLV